MRLTLAKCQQVVLLLGAIIALLVQAHLASVQMRRAEMELALTRYQLLQAQDAIGVLMDTARSE